MFALFSLSKSSTIWGVLRYLRVRVRDLEISSDEKKNLGE